jgi:hypothetical protein
MTRCAGAFRTGALASSLLVAALAGGCGAAATPSSPAPWADSPEALARDVLRAVQRQDRARLEQLAVSEDEFRALVWPQLPSSRPEVGLPIEYAWNDLQTKSRAHLHNTVATFGGESFDFLQITFAGEVTDYDTFRVHRKSVLEVRADSGETERVRLFGSMIEQEGRVKVFSYVVD